MTSAPDSSRSPSNKRSNAAGVTVPLGVGVPRDEGTELAVRLGGSADVSLSVPPAGIASMLGLRLAKRRNRRERLARAWSSAAGWERSEDRPRPKMGTTSRSGEHAALHTGHWNSVGLVLNHCIRENQLVKRPN